MRHYERTDRDGDRLIVDQASEDAIWVGVNRELAHVPAVRRCEVAQAVAGEGYRVVPAQDEPIDADVMIADLHAILDALGLGDHARPYSAHECVTRDVLPRIRELRDYINEGQPELPRVHPDDATSLMHNPPPPPRPDRPEPVNPAFVRVGDVVEIEANDGSWMVRGEVRYHDRPAARGENYRLIIGGPQYAESGFCPNLGAATVRILQRAEPEPDPEQVEAWHNWFGRLIMRMTDEGIDETAIKQASIELATAGVEVPSDACPHPEEYLARRAQGQEVAP